MQIFNDKVLETIDQIRRSIDFLRQHELHRMRAADKVIETRELLEQWEVEESTEAKKIKEYEAKLISLKDLLMYQLNPPQSSLDIPVEPAPVADQIGRDE